MAVMPNKPSVFTHEHVNFMIMDAPTNNNIHLYIKEFQKHNVKHLVRVCEPTYSSRHLEEAGIVLHSWPFDDGSGPPSDVVKNWLALVEEIATEEPGSTIGVHCVAGLGRAPVLVAIWLIENGMDALTAVEKIRAKRPGAINSKQIDYLEKYKPHRGERDKKCLIL